MIPALLLAALLAQEPPAPAPAPAPAPPPAPAPVPPAGGVPAVDPADQALLEELLAKATPLVERLRGLRFKSPVPIRPVTEEMFVDRYMEEFTRLLGGAERVGPASRLLARLGVLAEGDDLRAILGRFLQGNIAANYDPATGKVSFLPKARRTLPLMVHELTHALDDQHFAFKEQYPTWTKSIDRALAFGALAEGDAESLEARLLTGGMSGKAEMAQFRAQAEAVAKQILEGRFGRTPPALVLAFKAQYLEGVIFAETLRRTEKGEEAVNAAFRAPPPSTEHVLHPEKFLAGKDPPVAVPLKPAPEGARVLFETTLGELAAGILLRGRGLEADLATAAAAGWGGDTAALVAFPAGEALLWVSRWDTEEDAVAFHKAMGTAFPVVTGQASDKVTRLLVRRDSVVEYVEGPLDVLPAALEMMR